MTSLLKKLSMSIRSGVMQTATGQFPNCRPNPSAVVVSYSCELCPHRRRRRDATRQLSRVGLGGVHWAECNSLVVTVRQRQLMIIMTMMMRMVMRVSASAAEYCDWETFNVSCQADEVIAIGRARYGRMMLGRCVTTNYGSIGCGADVTPYMDSECSGRRACALNVITLSQRSLQTDKPCPPDFKYYLEATYECLKGTVSQTCSKLISIEI